MTRREFLTMLGMGAGGASSVALPAVVRGQATTAATAPASRPAPTVAPWIAETTGKSLVVEVRSQRAIIGRRIHEPSLTSAVDQAIRRLTDKNRTDDAWHALLRDDDVIGLKFNRSGASELGTNDSLVRVLVASLMKAGWAPEKIVLIETTHRLVKDLKTQPRRDGWRSEATHFGSGVDPLAAVLDQVTAIVNVPFLKANRIAGMSGCLKNLSHALCKHPAHYHGNAEPVPERGVLQPGRACAPYVGDIVASPPIRDKLRLHIVNALRTLREPMFTPADSTVETYGGIIAGRDPVATDMIGLEILNQQRRARNQSPLAAPDEPLPHIRAASQAGLGICNLDFIDHQTVKA